MNDLDLTKEEYAALTGEQKLVVAILQSWVSDLKKAPCEALFEETEDWLRSDGVMGPAFMDELLGWPEGTAARHVRMKLEDVRCQVS